MAVKKRLCDFEPLDGVTVVRFTIDKIRDEDTIDRIGQEMGAVVVRQGATHYLLDFSNVDYLSSAGMTLLVVLNRKVRKQQGTVSCCCVRPDIFELFKITQLDKALHVYPDRETGVKELRSAGQ